MDTYHYYWHAEQFWGRGQTIPGMACILAFGQGTIWPVGQAEIGIRWPGRQNCPKSSANRIRASPTKNLMNTP